LLSKQKPLDWWRRGVKQRILYIVHAFLAMMVCAVAQKAVAGQTWQTIQVAEVYPSESKSQDNDLPFLSFQEAWQNIQAHYPALRKQHFLLEEAMARHHQAVAGLLPRLQGSLAWSRSDDPTNVFIYKLKQESFTANDFLLPNLNDPPPRNDYSAALHLEVPIFDGYQTIASIQTTKHLLNSRESEKSFYEMEASLLAVESYLNAVLARRMTQFSDIVLKHAKADLKEAIRLKNQGYVLGADFYAGKVTSAFISKMRNALYARQRTAYTYLNILQGREADVDYDVASQLPVSDGPQKETKRWVHEAMLFRSDLTAMKEAVLAQESEVKRESSKILPRVSAFGEQRWHTNEFDHTGEHYAVGVQGTMDLFDPAYFTRISSSRAALEQRKQDLEALKDMITQTVSEASIQHQTYARDLELLKEASRDAREAVKSVEKLYQKGRKSIADLLQMRQMQLSTEIAYHETWVKVELARCRLLFLSGQLDDAEVKKIAKQIHP